MTNLLMSGLPLYQSRGLNQILGITPADIFDGKPKHNLFVDSIVPVNTFLGSGFLVLVLFGRGKADMLLVKF